MDDARDSAMIVVSAKSGHRHLRVFESAMKSRSAIVVAALVLMLGPLASAQTPGPALHWQPWSDRAFAEARAEHKFVLLDLEAVWCHWCHVMDDVTYRDPIVIRLLNERYVLVKVDQDSRPDIANRYQDWGWPATIVFAADGAEIVKRQGYIPPRPMSSMLQAIIADPSPGPSVEKLAAFHPAPSSSIPPALLTRVEAQYELQYDKTASGWAFGHKFLDRDSVEYALRLAANGNATYKKRVRDTLHAATALIDPVWGGMYQYSVDGVWSEPHFEKLAFIQAAALREYSLAYAQSQNPEDLRAAQAIHRFVTGFLTSPADGVFFVSQDADLHDGEENAPYFKLTDAARRAQGIPRVDTHVYARENGWMIAALCDYYAATGDGSALAEAQRAAHWIAQHRGLSGGGFRHGDADAAGPYLGDTLAMGQAFLALYNVTGDRADLALAAASARFIAANFAPRTPGSGFITARAGATSTQSADRDENVALVRFASLLAFATGDGRFHSTASEAMRYLSAPSVALTPLSAGILLASQDSANAPLHVTIVGRPADPAAIALHVAALRDLTSHELIEIRDPAHPTPTTVTYPNLSSPALFLCTASACSSPVFRPGDVRAKIQRAQLQSAH
ncbi:MAG TPA: DUF255 domain-containing protein [Terracidiphilus sp.]|nr:DUF255 domain-containing protein [Terracidiphilus sp.]